MTTPDLTDAPTVDDTTGFAVEFSVIPDDSKYDLLRFTLARIASDFPDKLAGIPTERIQRWIREVDAGRSIGELRDDIFQEVVGEEALQQWLDDRGIAGITPQQLIEGPDEGGVSLAEAAEGGVPSTPGATERVGGVRIPGDMRLVRIIDPEGTDATEIFLLVGSVFGVDVGYEIGDIGRVRELFGGVDAFDDVSTVDQQQFDNSGILSVGTVDEIAGSTESLQARYERDLRAAGADNPPQWLAGDQEAMTRWMIGVNEGFSAERQWVEVSDTDAFKDRFGGLDTIFSQLGTNQFVTAISEYTRRENLIRQSLVNRRGPGADTSVGYVSGLIGSGWAPAEVDELLTLERRLVDQPDILDNMNEILAFQRLPELSPDDFITFLQEGQRATVDPSFIPGDLFEGINDALRFQALIEEGVRIDAQFATDLGEGVSDVIASPDQFSDRARIAAIEIARNTTELERGTLGISRDSIIAAIFGETSPTGESVAETSELLERLGRDRAKRATGLPNAPSFIDAIGRLRVQGLSNL